jgi:hypothetical protein
MRICWKNLSCIICSCECGDDAFQNDERVKKKRQQKTSQDAESPPPSTITARIVTLPPSLESLQAQAQRYHSHSQATTYNNNTPQSSQHKPKKHKKHYAATTKRRLKELVDTSQSV